MAVDDKVVSIDFESGKFEAGINRTIAALEKLKAALHFPSAGKGLDDINASAKRVDLGHIARGVDAIKGKLSALSVAALAVFANIATQAVAAGARLIKALTIDPIIQGYQEYETKLNSIQTILSNTQAAGTNLKDVSQALNQLNTYADKTIYNFSEMTRNIGTFTAAGVDLKTAVASIKGIANLAAISGSNAQQASTAMYQLSQAISSGTVKLMDWNSVVNAGMGGTVFQRALAQTAVHMGTLKKGAVELSGAMKNVKINGESFRNSLASSGPGKQSWLTSKVLTTTLKQLSGDMTDAQLAAEGYTKAQIKAIQTQAKMALQAATQVKTLHQLLDTTKEAVGSGWAQTWEIIFGNFGEARTLFTNISNSVNKFVSASANARNKVLSDWKALGGRTLLLNSLKTAFQALAAIMRPIKQAFRDIFPAQTGKSLFELTKGFSRLAQAMKPSQQTIASLRSTFRGLFAALDIGKQIFQGVLTMFAHMFKAAGAGQGGILKFTGTIGDFIYNLDKALKSGNKIQTFFAKLGDILAAPLKILLKLKDAIGSLFSGFSSGGISGAFGSLGKSMGPLEKIMGKVSSAWDKMVASIKSADFQSLVDKAADALRHLGNALEQAVSDINFDRVIDIVKTGFFAALILAFKNFLGKGSFAQQLVGATGGGFMKNLNKIGANIAASFDALRGSLVALQQNIKANTLKQIAIAVGVLAASMVALSFVDPKKLNNALSGIALGLGALLGAMGILGKISKSLGFLKLPFIASGLIALAAAVFILSGAVIALSFLDWSGLLKGLTGVAGILTGLVAVVGPISKASKGMIVAGLGLDAIAAALVLLVIPMEAFSRMKWGQILKGLTGVAGGLAALAAGIRVMPSGGMIAMGIGLTGVAFALVLIQHTMAKFSGMKWGQIGKGMAAVGGGLVAIAAAMNLMPEGMIVQAAGLAIVAFSLGKIAKAVSSLGKMSWGAIAKGLTALSISLSLLALAMVAMEEGLPGAAALAVAAAGLLAISHAMNEFGNMSWQSILKSLVELAGTLAILGAAGMLLTPAIPGLLGLGAAMLMIGGGLALIGVGMTGIAAGITALSIALPIAAQGIVNAILTIINAAPKIAESIGQSMIAITTAIVKASPEIAAALLKLIEILAQVVVQATPIILSAFGQMLGQVWAFITSSSGNLISAGLGMVLDLIKGILSGIGQIVTTTLTMIGRFIATVVSSTGRLIATGAQMAVAFVKGILSRIGNLIVAAAQLMARFVTSILSKIGTVVAAGVTIVTRFVSGILSKIASVVQAGISLISRLVSAILGAGGQVTSAGSSTMSRFISGFLSKVGALISAGVSAMHQFTGGLLGALSGVAAAAGSAAVGIGVAIGRGMLSGIESMAGSVASAAANMAKSAVSSAYHFLKPGSPSKVFYALGQLAVQGFAMGLDQHKAAVDSAIEMSKRVIQGFKDTFQITSPSKVMIQIGQYVGQGFAQGLHGSKDDINKAFMDLNKMLTESMALARKTIAEEQAKLRQLRAADKPDAAAIAAAQKIIDENEQQLKRSQATRALLVKGLSDEKKKLIGLVNQYQQLGDKLKAAQQALVDAKQAREDAIKGFADQYSTLPDIVTSDAGDTLAQYEAALKAQADSVAAYQATLDQLRALGLDDATYQKLLAEGPADQAFANQLLAGGKTAIDGLNALDKQLKDNADKLAKSAGHNLYDAGVASAQGLIKGLKSKESAIYKAMQRLARLMVKAIKDELGIKSPSEVFAEVGRYSMEGFVQGFVNTSGLIKGAVEDAAAEALTATQRMMSKLSDVVAAGIDTDPVITPILDLTQVRSQAGELATLTKVTPITAAASYGQASAISAGYNANQNEIVAAAAGGTSLKFEQNNYSPDALSEIEIYRMTKNQLSQAKSVLALS